MVLCGLEEIGSTLLKPRVAELVKPYRAGCWVNQIKKVTENVGATKWGAHGPQRTIFAAKFLSCRDHIRRPALYECSEAVERLGEIVFRRGKAQPKMRGRIETIAGSQQDSTLGGGLAKRAVVLSAH